MIAHALLDSNILIAAVAGAHEHHAPSLALFLDADASFAVSSHSYAEAFCTLTRLGDRAPFRFSPEEAWASLESIRAVTALVGLTPAQSFDAVRSYAETGGIGARLFDRLIGEAAVIHGIPALVTWNTGHMRRSVSAAGGLDAQAVRAKSQTPRRLKMARPRGVEPLLQD